MNLMSFNNSFSRLDGSPLDSTEIWNSLDDAKEYAKTANAYVGQIIKVVDENKVDIFKIDVDKELKKINDDTDSSYITSEILFKNNNGDNTSSTISLKDDINNYNYIEIIYGTSNGLSSSKVMINQNVSMSIIQSDSGCFKIITGKAILQNNQLIRGNNEEEQQLVISYNNDGQFNFTNSISSDDGYYISIYRVIGYKENDDNLDVDDNDNLDVDDNGVLSSSTSTLDVDDNGVLSSSTSTLDVDDNGVLEIL